MPLFEGKIDLVGVDIELRFKQYHSIAFVTSFKDSNQDPVDVTTSVFVAAIWDTEDDSLAAELVADMADAAIGIVVLTLEDTSLLTIHTGYKWEFWKVDGTAFTFLMQGPVTVENTLIEGLFP